MIENFHPDKQGAYHEYFLVDLADFAGQNFNFYRGGWLCGYNIVITIGVACKNVMLRGGDQLSI